MSEKPRILVLDIEIIPDLKAARRVWTRLSDFPGRTIKADINSIINFGYKWNDDPDQPEVKILNAWDYPNWDKNINDDSEICKDIIPIIKEAEVVVTQNGKKFDWKFIETRLALNGLERLQKPSHVDTRRIASKYLHLVSNSLKDMATIFLEEKKMDNEGWNLWVRVMDKDPEAMDIMSRYCKQDIVTTEALFEEFRKYCGPGDGLPNFNSYRRDGVECCPNCGKFNLMKNGTKPRLNHIAQMWLCKDCGSPSTTRLEKINKQNTYPKQI